MDKLFVSYGVSKLGNKIPCVSLPAITTCRKDAPCAKECYARKGHFTLKTVREKYVGNLALWRDDPEAYEKGLFSAAYFGNFFRYHSAGDIPDVGYFRMMIRVANDAPQTRFLCFTKKYELVNAELGRMRMAREEFPENLTVVLSAWKEFLPRNPFNLPVSYVRFKDVPDPAIPENARQCPRYCGSCVMTRCSCWDLKSGEAVVFNKH